MSAKCTFFADGKTVFCQSMRSHSHGKEFDIRNAPCRILGSTEFLWLASFLPMVLHGFNMVFTLRFDKQRRIFSVNPG